MELDWSWFLLSRVQRRRDAQVVGGFEVGMTVRAPTCSTPSQLSASDGGRRGVLCQIPQATNGIRTHTCMSWGRLLVSLRCGTVETLASALFDAGRFIRGVASEGGSTTGLRAAVLRLNNVAHHELIFLGRRNI